MASFRLALVCATAVLLLAPQPAVAGGWWSYIDVDRSTVAPGQRVEVKDEVYFRSTAAVEEAAKHGQFYVYLLRDFDYSVVERAMHKARPGDWWSLGGAEAIQVGQVAISVSPADLGKARATFTVPELAPDTYHLMLCDAGCAEPLAENTIPAKGFTVVADPALARTAQRLEQLERRIWNQGHELTATRRAADRVREAEREARSEVNQLEQTVSSLGEEVRSLPRATPWAYAGWLVAGALAGTLALLVLRRRRSGRPPQVTDEELRELLSTEPADPRSPSPSGSR